jgi:hypothetical protein
MTILNHEMLALGSMIVIWSRRISSCWQALIPSEVTALLPLLNELLTSSVELLLQLLDLLGTSFILPSIVLYQWVKFVILILIRERTCIAKTYAHTVWEYTRVCSSTSIRMGLGHWIWGSAWLVMHIVRSLMNKAIACATYWCHMGLVLNSWVIPSMINFLILRFLICGDHQVRSAHCGCLIACRALHLSPPLSQIILVPRVDRHLLLHLSLRLI